MTKNGTGEKDDAYFEDLHRALMADLGSVNCSSNTLHELMSKDADSELECLFFNSQTNGVTGHEQIMEGEAEIGPDNVLPSFEDFIGSMTEIEDLSLDRKKQFVFLHSIVNSSSDDSQFQDSDDEADQSLSPVPIAQNAADYRFELTETPMPLPEPVGYELDEEEAQARSMLTMPRLVEYSIPRTLKHLLCTDDNLMGLSDSMTLERIVRKKSLADIIPMCSQGTRTFHSLTIDFSPTYQGGKNLINISTFIQKLSDKFQPRIGSFFNTKFQLSYKFDNGRFEIEYGIFEDHDFFTQEIRDIDYIDLHVFSRYLPKKSVFEAGARNSRFSPIDNCEREWRNFITMTDVYNLVDHLLKGKCSFIQNSSRLLKYIKKGGSLRVAAKHYEASVHKNQQRILSNIREYIENNQVMSPQKAKMLRKEGRLDDEFRLGLFEQIVGYFDDLGLNSRFPAESAFVIELKDFEEVIKSISAKYVYERYVHPVSDK